MFGFASESGLQEWLNSPTTPISSTAGSALPGAVQAVTTGIATLNREIGYLNFFQTWDSTTLEKMSYTSLRDRLDAAGHDLLTNMENLTPVVLRELGLQDHSVYPEAPVGKNTLHDTTMLPADIQKTLEKFREAGIDVVVEFNE